MPLNVKQMKEWLRKSAVSTMITVGGFFTLMGTRGDVARPLAD